MFKDQRTIARHPDNNRSMASHEKTMDDSILAQGVCWWMRGECWLIWSSALPHGAITAGTTTTSFYTVYERVKDHPEMLTDLIKDSLEHGAKVRFFSSGTPREVRIFLKDCHNKFHSGVDHTFLEVACNAVSHN